MMEEDIKMRKTQFEKNVNRTFWVVVVVQTAAALVLIAILAAVVTAADRQIEKQGGLGLSIGHFIGQVQKGAKQ